MGQGAGGRGPGTRGGLGGFTLIELVLSTVLMLFATGMLFVAMGHGIDATSLLYRRGYLVEQGQQALNRMGWEIAGTVVTGPYHNMVAAKAAEFAWDPPEERAGGAGPQVQYRYSYDSTQKWLHRETPAGLMPWIAYNVDGGGTTEQGPVESFAFAYLDETGQNLGYSTGGTGGYRDPDYPYDRIRTIRVTMTLKNLYSGEATTVQAQFHPRQSGVSDPDNEQVLLPAWMRP